MRLWVLIVIVFMVSTLRVVEVSTLRTVCPQGYYFTLPAPA